MARRRYTPKLKAQVVLEVLAGDRTPRQVANAYGVHSSSVGLWKRCCVERVSEIVAEDVGLLPDDMFTRMLEHPRRQPE